MKSKKFLVILSAILLGVFVFAACSNINQEIFESLSEVYHGVYEGASADVSVKVITGKREKNYQMDGVSGTKADFTVLTISPEASFGAPAAAGETKKYSYMFSAGGKTHEGDFKEDKTNGKFSAEIVLNIGNIPEFQITVKTGETTSEVTVKSKMVDIISYTDALDLAKLEFKTELEALYSDGKLHCEIYIRYINSSGAAESEYFWYVAFMQPDKSFFAVLIDPVNSSIVAKRS